MSVTIFSCVKDVAYVCRRAEAIREAASPTVKNQNGRAIATMSVVDIGGLLGGHGGKRSMSYH